jgi:hypothetical protein
MIDMTNMVFVRLTVTEYYGTASNRQKLWTCQCSCGAFTEVSRGSLTSGNTRSCGCLQKEEQSARQVTKYKDKPLTFRQANRSAYSSWVQLKFRCRNKNSNDYKDYGGRGITVCDRWLESFENFMEDMGTKPDNTEIDRTENSGNYEPGNCEWVTHAVNMKNRRNSKPVLLLRKDRSK